MNILDKIVSNKLKEVEASRNLVSVSVLESKQNFYRKTVSLKQELQRHDRHGIIAEFKRKSPSKGIINDKASVEETTTGYINAGASALSVLTDNQFFGGSSNDLISARKVNSCPVLRKDFIIDEYQLIEAKSIGADVVLLIASVLDAARVNKLTRMAHSLNLEVLLEVHNEDEIVRNLDAEVDLIGVNNRDLKTFDVSLDVSKRLSEIIPDSFTMISESGIDVPEAICELRNYGYRGFLMGEAFMREADPGKAATSFIEKLNTLI